MRFVGERKALAALVLAVFALLFLLNGLLGPAPLQAMFLCLGGVYVLAFFGLVAGYFWARWYALGIGLSGVAMALIGFWQIGAEPVLMFWGGAHAVIALVLIGKGPTAAFDGRKDWRERYRMDDDAANRLGKAIMRAGASLPYLIAAGLAPKQSLGLALWGFGVVALGVLAVVGLFRLRVWGVLALAATAALAVATLGQEVGWFALTAGSFTAIPGAGVVAAALLAFALVPFVRPVVRFLRA